MSQITQYGGIVVELGPPGYKPEPQLPRFATRQRPAIYWQSRAGAKGYFTRTERNFRKQLQRTFGRFAEGRLGEGQLRAGFSAALQTKQIQMYLAGRRSSGNFSPYLSPEELRWLHGQHSNQMRYFHGFLRDMAAGKGRMPYDQRMDLYGLSLHQVYERGAVVGNPNRQRLRYFWIWEEEACHCETCIRNHHESEAKGGFTYDEVMEVYGFPGQHTACLNRCRCRYEVRSVVGRPVWKHARKGATAFIGG